jgi:hypothetical protein
VQLSPQTSEVPRMAMTQDRPRFIDDRRPVCKQPEEDVEVLSAQRAGSRLELGSDHRPVVADLVLYRLPNPPRHTSSERLRPGARGRPVSWVGRPSTAGRSKTDGYRHVVGLYAAACPAVCRLLGPSSQETPR